MNAELKKQAKVRDPFYYTHKNFVVGIFVIIPVALLLLLTGFILIKSDYLERWIYLHIRCESGNGLKTGTPVNILGINVGHIKTLSLNDRGYVDITLKVKRRYMHFIHEDSKARPMQKNFVVGDWEIDLTVGNKNSPVIHDQDTLHVEYPIKLDVMVEKITRMVTPLEKLILSLENGEGLLRYIIGSDTSLLAYRSVIHNANALINDIHTVIVKADTMIGDVASFGRRGTVTLDSFMILTGDVDKLLDRMGKVTANLNGVVDSIKPMPRELTNTLLLLQKDLREAEILMKGIQNHWLLRKTIEKQKKSEEK
jgi:ABC-type transporter Mla subunit MlaD